MCLDSSQHPVHMSPVNLFFFSSVVLVSLPSVVTVAKSYVAFSRKLPSNREGLDSVESGRGKDPNTGCQWIRA